MKRSIIISLFSLAIILPGVFASGANLQETEQRYSHIENGVKYSSDHTTTDFSINIAHEEGNYYHCENTVCSVNSLPDQDFDRSFHQEQDVNAAWGPQYKWP